MLITPLMDGSAFGATNFPRYQSYRPEVDLELSSGDYTLRTARGAEDLERVFKLRYRIFRGEYGLPVSPLGIDTDHFDMNCDHLCVIHRPTGEFVGTYRVTTSNRARRFYSQEEFDLEPLLELPGTKMELGRACVAPEHRMGPALKLLWRGLLVYRKAVGARYLFGCSSVKTEDASVASRVCAHLDSMGRMRWPEAVAPTASYRMPGFAREAAKQDADQDLIPPLLESYLRAGAEVWGEPAWDRDFHCIDLLTILDFENMSLAYGRFGK